MGKLSVKSLQKLYFRKVIRTKDYWQFRKMLKPKARLVEYERKPFKLSEYTEDECRLYFRFIHKEIEELISALNLPPTFRMEHRVVFTGLEGLCIVLRRLASPDRFYDLVSMFHRDGGTLSSIFNFMLEYLYTSHAHRLHKLEQPYLTRGVLTSLADDSCSQGCPYPNIVGYIDGTNRQICRPSTNQGDYYSGYKKKHAVKYQSIVLTNGLIGRLDGPFKGRRHDAAILRLSGILDEMRQYLVNNDGTHFAVYGDPGYTNQEFIKVGYKNFKRLNDRQRDFNALMSKLRVGVEYGFGLILQQFPFLDFFKKQKVRLNRVKEAYFVAAFLINCQSCMRGGNQTSQIFNSYVPTLEEYLL